MFFLVILTVHGATASSLWDMSPQDQLVVIITLCNFFGRNSRLIFIPQLFTLTHSTDNIIDNVFVKVNL